MTEFVNFWKNYVNFSDRTTRRGYWMAYLFLVIVAIVVAIIAVATGFTLLSTLWSLAILVPSLAMTIRRFRDAGKGWPNIFWVFLPIIGWIIYLIILCKPSVESDGTPVV